MSSLARCGGWLIGAWLSIVLFGGCSSFGLTKWRNPFAAKKTVVPGLVSPTDRIEKLREIAKAAPQMPPDQAELHSTQLLQEIKKEDDAVIKMEILHTLAVLPTATAGAVLEAATRDPDRNIREYACTAWRIRGGQQAVEQLKKTIQGDADRDVRMAAARELGTLGDPSAVAVLGQMLEETDPAMQYRAMQSLKQISKKDFGDDVAAWKSYAQGGTPQELSLVSRIFRRS